VGKNLSSSAVWPEQQVTHAMDSQASYIFGWRPFLCGGEQVQTTRRSYVPDSEPIVRRDTLRRRSPCLSSLLLLHIDYTLRPLVIATILIKIASREIM